MFNPSTSLRTSVQCSIISGFGFDETGIVNYFAQLSIRGFERAGTCGASVFLQIIGKGGFELLHVAFVVLDTVYQILNLRLFLPLFFGISSHLGSFLNSRIMGLVSGLVLEHRIQHFPELPHLRAVMLQLVDMAVYE